MTPKSRPERSSSKEKHTEVLSLPVGALSSAASTKKRVMLLSSSCIPSASSEAP